MSIQTYDQKEVTVGGNKFLITAFDATYGLGVMNQIRIYEEEGKPYGADFVKTLVIRSTSMNNIKMDEKMYNATFARKYPELFELFGEILKFNFGGDDEETVPNELSDTLG